MKKILLALFLSPVLSFGQTLQSNPDLAPKLDYRIAELNEVGDSVIVTYRFANDSVSTKTISLGLNDVDIRNGLFIKPFENKPVAVRHDLINVQESTPEEVKEDPIF